LVSDIPAGDWKTINLFYSVKALAIWLLFTTMTKRVKYLPILELPLVVVELDAARVLHAAHDVDHILLFHHHDGGDVSPFFLQSINHVTSNNILLIDSFDSKDVSSPTSNQSGNSQSTHLNFVVAREDYTILYFFFTRQDDESFVAPSSSSTKRRQKKYFYKS
jgi:hypothetical protein